ncbi:hypothetical protein KSP40_PGU009663 [Platanthera guangdongensis]|uniref:Helicase-like transcription factor CHR28 n=1 Tax=Platanthera guangdongensis TaxID=2320717 RepID=A0ABR2LZV2_9ASPA
MENAPSHLLPMRTEVINIGSSESDDDIDFDSDESFVEPFTDGTSTQHHSVSAPYAHISDGPWAGTSVEHLKNNVGKNSQDEAGYLSSEGAFRSAQSRDHLGLTPQNTYKNSRSSGRFDAHNVSDEEVMHDVQRDMHKQLMSPENLESGSGATGQSTDLGVSLNSKRTLPPSLQPRTSGAVSAPSTSFHGKSLSFPHKNHGHVENNRWSRAGTDYNADSNVNFDQNFNQKRTNLPHGQPKKVSTGHLDEQASGQIPELQEIGHGSGKSKMPGSKLHVEDFGEMVGKNQIIDSERRALPSHWIDKTANSSQMNGSINSRVSYQHSNFSTKTSYPMLASKGDDTHKFSDLSIRNEKLSTSSKKLYKDDVFLFDNAPPTRTLPQYPGKSNGNPRLAGSDGVFPGSGEHRLENNEMPIYQEALQNLAQPKLEDDLPEGLMTISLLKHQKIALAWMIQKEKSVHCAGGILADDQGLGKTISMIALILKQKSLQSKFTSDSSPPVKPEALNLDDDEGSNEVDVKDIGKDYLQREQIASTSENRRPAAGTLVVCPASILRQWAHELEEKVSSSVEFSVLVYHGGARAKDPRALAKHDIVLTTYSIVTNEVPRQPSVDDDDENEQKNMEKYGLSSEFATRKKRKQSSNAGRKGKKKGKESQLDCGGPLARVRWFRVILDEAQTIKNHRTQVARACSGLRAKRRWCLSGTPMQNAIDDLYSYFRFLKYEPYAVYSSFCNSIKYPISRNASQGYKKLQAVLRIVLLRRTKGTQVNGEPIIKLPPKSINLKNVEFSLEERAFYLKLEGDSRQQFKAYAAAGTVKQNYANILLMLLRLRQACDHPVLVKGYCSTAIARDSLEMARQLPKEMVLNLLYQLEASLSFCPACHDTPEDPVITMCGHVFCYPCISERITGDDNLCPAAGCKDILGTDLVFSQATLKACICEELDNNEASSSSKHCDESSILQDGYASSKD